MTSIREYRTFRCPHCTCELRRSFLTGWWAQWKCDVCGKASWVLPTADKFKIQKTRPRNVKGIL